MRFLRNLSRFWKSLPNIGFNPPSLHNQVTFTCNFHDFHQKISQHHGRFPLPWDLHANPAFGPHLISNPINKINLILTTSAFPGCVSQSNILEISPPPIRLWFNQHLYQLKSHWFLIDKHFQVASLLSYLEYQQNKIILGFSTISGFVASELDPVSQSDKTKCSKSKFCTRKVYRDQKKI